MESTFIVNHHCPLVEQLSVFLFVGSRQRGLFGVEGNVVFVGMGTIDDYAGIGKWPEIDLFTQFQQCQLDETFQIDEVVHVYFFLR